MNPRPRVLVVEDEALISEMLNDALSDDYEVVCADNVAQALSAIRDQRIDVILLDAYLHGETGAAVGKHAEQTEVPLIWMTGDPDALVNLGVDASIVLRKPFDLQRLSETIAKARGL